MAVFDKNLAQLSHFKMLITQPRSKKNQNGPRTSLMGPGGAVWGKKPTTKIS